MISRLNDWKSSRPFTRLFQIIFFSGFFFILNFSSKVVQSQAEPQLPVVTFAVDFPASEPERYSIRIPTDGPAHYQSSGRLSTDSDVTDNFDFDFAVTAETRKIIFELAKKADYFQKDLDSRHKGLAFTGRKTLSYRDASRMGDSSYNYSSNQAVQELTGLMQNLSNTLEFGHRLRYELQYQKLALDDELKQLEEREHNNERLEINAIQPILDQIIADESVINVTRARAQRLLQRAH
jgi:hypothetical protein